MLRLPRLRDLDESLTLRFVMPVIFENCWGVIIGMVIAVVSSSISSSALAAIGMADSVANVISAFFSIITASVSILVSRQIGAGEYEDAADSIEQITFLGLVLSAIVTVLCVVFASPILKLVMPTAEETMFGEAVRYFRVLMLSFPSLIVWSSFTGALRAMGKSRAPMITAVVSHLVRLFIAWLSVSVLGLNEIGIGISFVLYRTIGMVMLFRVLVKDKSRVVLRVKNMLRPNFATCKRIFNIGVPMSVESIFVQIGYMLAGSMAIALGAFESGVNSIINTINSFTSIPWAVCSVVAMSAVGHILGSKNYGNVRKAGFSVMAVGVLSCAVLGGLALIFGEQFCGLYSDDPATVKEASALLWILLPLNFFGCTINTNDPQLRVGGDVKYVMVITLIAVWAIRLPLTYLMCFVWDFGVLGIFLANTVSLVFRAAMGLIRYFGNKWMYKKV